MKIYTVTEDYLSAFQGLFAGHDVSVLPRNYREKNLRPDLLIFTGGADVYPEWYGGQIPKGGSTWFNRDRDNWEFGVLRDVQIRKLYTSKVLGVCRGLQLLNVGFGGSLVYDIYTRFGREHDYAHPLSWVAPSPLAEIFPTVNSMHHQGIYRIGDSRGYKVYANEPTTDIIEVICWEEKYLGVQFHPEFMTKSPNIEKFVEFLGKWVKEEDYVNRNTKPSEIPAPIKSRRKISSGFWDIAPDVSSYTSLSSIEPNHDEE